MSTIRELLQDGDPLRQELPRLDANRELMRARLVDAAVTRAAARSRTAIRSTAGLVVVALALVALIYGVWSRAETPVFAAVEFQVRLAEEQPVAGLVVAQVKGTSRLVYLHPEIVADNDDVTSASVVDEGNGRYSVAVQFAVSAAERLRQATTAHVGRPLAIVLNGQVVLTPVVRGPIGDSAVITGDYSQVEAERLANGITQR